MLRTTIAVMLAAGSQAVPLSYTEKALGLMSAAQALLPYSKYTDTYCPEQDELGTGKGAHTRSHVKTLEDCANSCSDVGICISFEWVASTVTCTRSTTCTPENGATTTSGVNLYVKQHPLYTPYYATACHDKSDDPGTLEISHPDKSDGCSRVPGGGCSQINACQDLCTDDDDCISFQFKHETDRCILSSTCTHNMSHTNHGGWNLFVKKAPPSPSPPPFTHSQSTCRPACTDAVWNTPAHNTRHGKNSSYTCGERITWRAAKSYSGDNAKACTAVGEKFAVCSACK